MAYEEIIAGNNLIAEFMGYRIKTYSDTSSYGYGSTDYLYTKGDGITTDQVFYNESWDWLMPVVKQILDSENVYCIQITNIRLAMFPISIVRLWQTVVEYIRWFNEQNK